MCLNFVRNSRRMKSIYFVVLCLSLTLGSIRGKKSLKIGIIGGGIGGTSCAYFLKSLFGEGAVDIDLYEADKVGGRLSVVDFSQKLFEEGGSIIHSQNKYMVDFLQEFNLTKRESPSGYFALYNGKDFVFSESEWQLITLLKVIYRYGFGFWKLRNYIEDMLKKFERIYDIQSRGETFNTVGSMLAAINPKFADYLHVTTKLGFKSQGMSQIIIDEIVMATIRANYGQNLNIQKMVGSVSVAGAIGGLWSVHGGNVMIPEMLLRASKANFVNLVVTSVKRTASGRLRLTTGPRKDEGKENRVYDVVIVAAPQTSDSKFKIDFQDFEEEIRFPGKYHKTVCTLVEGKLSENHFPKKNPIIDEILTTSNEVSFNSIGRITPVDYVPQKYGKSNVWKVFTQNRMNDEEVSSLFSEVRRTHAREWLAYPHYETSFRNDSFVLAPNLYHVSAIEWAASAMEMSVIGAKNVALLAHKNFLSEYGDVSASLPQNGKTRDEL